MSETHKSELPGLMKSRAGWVLVGFVVIGAFFLWTEHRAHVFGVLPYLLLFSCPLMHLFMHHGRSGHGGHHHHDSSDERRRSAGAGERRP